MATRPGFRTAFTLLSVSALAGLIGVGNAQSPAHGAPAGQPPDPSASRQVLLGAYASSLGAVMPNAPATPELVRGGRLLRMTAPAYPAAARQASVSGVVTIEARIGADGRVVQTSVLRGPGPLRQIALDAVRSWRFEPTLLNGKPVERVAEVALRFVLGRH
jgi:TonB family protein